MGFVALLIIPIAIVVGLGRYQSIQAKQRNAAARYMPEYEVTYTPKRLVTEDVPLGRLDHRGGSEVEGRNDNAPQQRAAYFRAVLVPRTPPPAAVAGPTSTDATPPPPDAH